MKTKLALIIVLIVMLGVLGGVGTMAWFTSSTISTGNEFKTGTLKLGSESINGTDRIEEFGPLNVSNIKPGEPRDVGEVFLKNVGTLPMKLYRITGFDFSGDLYHQDEQERKLDDLLELIVTIENEDNHVYQVKQCKFSQLQEENGGYFDPIFELKEYGDKAKMTFSVLMDETAGNEFQGKSFTCSLKVYASQVEMPKPGESSEYEYIGTSDITTDDGTYYNQSEAITSGEYYFKAYGKNNNSNSYFRYEWCKNDAVVGDPAEDLDWYEIRFKHHTGSTSKEIIVITDYAEGEIRVKDKDGNPIIYSGGIQFDKTNDLITIPANFFTWAFGQDAKTVEAEFYGKTHQGTWHRTTVYKWWTIPN